MKKLLIISIIVLILTSSLAIFASNVQAQNSPSSGNPVHVQAGMWLINIQKVDLSASSYRLDFYLWFSFNPQQISADEVSQFEFINGQPAIKQIDANESYLEYRVTGDFLKTFDFSMYPFESHSLTIELEHSNLACDSLVYDIDSSSSAESTANVAGWDLGSLQNQVIQHSYGDQTFSRPVYTINLSRPMASSFIKSVLPISVITAISLLAFIMAAEDYAQKMALGISTLLTATAFHLSLVSGIPPTGYLTFADQMMISIYLLFLFNIGSAVYLMRLSRENKTQQATAYNRKALRILPIVIIALAIITVVI